MLKDTLHKFYTVKISVDFVLDFKLKLDISQ